MHRDATYTGRDDADNHWYAPSWFVNLFAGGRGEAFSNDYKLDTPDGKRLAMRYCFPFASVIDRCGKMMMNGKFYVTDRNDNENNGARYRQLRQLLENPNPMQNGRAFIYQVETSLRCYGFCPIYLLRLGKNDTPDTMVVIPPYLFHMEGTGKLFAQTDSSEIIKRAYIKIGDSETILEDYEYIVISDSTPIFGTKDGEEVRFVCVTDSLSPFTRNYMSSLIARGNLIVNGGPKGILYGNDTSELGNAALTPNEADKLNEKFKRKFGLVNKMYEIAITDKKVGWIPLGSNTQQLMLHDETDRCQRDICNAIGAQPDLFSQGATFDNKEAAKKATYQDLIIPDAKNIGQALTNVLCENGMKIYIDFSEVSCLQEDRAKYAESLNKAATALNALTNGRLLTQQEARRELANYIDIDPENPFGEFVDVQQQSVAQQTTE